MRSVFVFIAVMVLSVVVSKPVLDLGAILSGIPEDEQSQFLKYHIKRGHDLSGSNEPVTRLNDSDTFCVALYKFAKQQYAIEDEHQLEVLSNIICFDDGLCIDIGDVGVHPKLL